MRLLFVIPHYFNAKGTGEAAPNLPRKHASVTGAAESRLGALHKTVYSLHQTFGTSQAMIRHADRTTVPANADMRHEVHVVVVTCGQSHLMNRASFDAADCHQFPVDDDPTRLGFHCHNVLRDRWGNYDYYSYLEDDLSLSDGWFFEKLRWFNGHVGNGKLLLPNRYERADKLAYKKCYLDGDLAGRVTEPFQAVNEKPELKSTVMGRSVRLVRPRNPHSGCFFLNSDQMQTWIERPYFGDRDASFIGPLESAATLGVMKTFAIYKPAPENACFLEIEHDDSRYIKLVRKG